MILGLLILIVTGVATAALGAVVYLRNPKSAMSRSFLLFSISVIAWTTANFYVDAAPSLSLSLVSTRATMATGFSALFWLYIFSRNLDSRLKTRGRTRLILSSLFIVGCIFSASSLVVESVRYGEIVVNVTFGEAYSIYVALMAVMVLATFWQLYALSRHGTRLEKIQVKLIAWGIVTSVGLLVFINIIAPFFVDDLYLLRVSPALTLSMTGFISYAIVKHRLFDIRFIVARSVAYLLVLLAMGGVYSVVVFSFVNRLFTDSNVSIYQQLTYMAVALLLAFTFQPLKSFFDRVTDRIFYRDRYSVEDLVANITSMAASTLDLDDLSERTLTGLTEGMRAERASLWVVDDEDFYCAASYNIKPEDLGKYDGGELIEVVIAHGKELVLVEDLERKSQVRILRRLQVEVMVPLMAGSELQGVLLLGGKRSGEIYTSQDVNALKILGPSLAISLENARSYKRISEFNQILEKEISKATYSLTVANQKLSHSNAKLRQLDSLKDEFISITSHELRTPLTAIRGYLWMAMHGKARSEAMHQNYMERAYTSTERLIALVNDSLDISRIDSGRVQLNPVPTDIKALAAEVVSDLKPKADQQEQVLRIKRSGRLPAVMVDPEKLYQVLTNLVGNALKFTPNGGKIEVIFEVDGAKLITTIKDSGPGISDEDKKRLFQKFSRLDASATIPGTGLGLFLCKEIINMSKGKIWIESQVGEGSEFKFSLPVTTLKSVRVDRIPHAQRLVGGV